MLDATQACGWLLDATRFDVLVCAAYKWLCSPRGTAFMTVRPEVAERLVPHGAGGTHGLRPARILLRAASAAGRDARRFDVTPRGSPGWRQRPRSGRCWTSDRADPSGTTCAWPTCSEGPRPPSRRLGDRVHGASGRGGAPARLAGDGCRPRELLRTSWHLYNSREDVEQILERLSPGAARRPPRGSARHRGPPGRARCR